MIKFIRDHSEMIFLYVMSITGMGFLFMATRTYGAGLPSDSAWYISAAENLLRGNGLITFDTGPLNAFPPLFTFIIAFLSEIFVTDVFIVGWYLNGLLIGFNIFLCGLLLLNIFSSDPIFYYFGVCFITLSPSFMRMHASILTEPFFMAMMLLSIFVAQKYMIKPEIRLILGLGILAALAPLLRFVGLSFILSGFALILYVHRWNWKKTVTRSILFGLVSCTPIFLWLYFYNFRLFGAFLYPTNPRRPDIWINLLQAVRKVYFWFVPYRPIFKDGVMDALIVLLGLLIILFISNRLINWKSLLHRIREPYVFCTLIYSAVYLGAITATANTSDHYALVSDRYYAVIIYFILVVLFICIEKLIQPHFPVSFRAFSLGLTVIAILWLMVPFSRMAEYILKSRASGEDGYNLYNTRVYHESDLMKYAIKLQHENPEANIYSNVPAAVWFFTRSNMLPLPNNYQSWTKDQFKKKMAGWPNDKPGYIVWFTPDPFEIFYSPKDLYLIADIYPIQKAADGTVYYVTVRK